MIFRDALRSSDEVVQLQAHSHDDRPYRRVAIGRSENSVYRDGRVMRVRLERAQHPMSWVHIRREGDLHGHFVVRVLTWARLLDGSQDLRAAPLNVVSGDLLDKIYVSLSRVRRITG